jgi:hypothetical protein
MKERPVLVAFDAGGLGNPLEPCGGTQPATSLGSGRKFRDIQIVPWTGSIERAARASLVQPCRSGPKTSREW